jgi:hypothetical protein
MLFGDFFKDSIFVDAARHPAMAELGKMFHGAGAMAAARPSPRCRSGWRWAVSSRPMSST